MTDKEQIIIDGVDILDCDNYYVEQETDQVKCDLSDEYCRENKNCFYKQLARKTQECEELKEQLKIKDNENSNLNKKYRQEQDERRSYRKALEEIEDVIKTPCAEDCVYYELSRCYDCIKTSILNIIGKVRVR